MAGGPGGTGGGVATSSLLWAIVMSAFAGSCITLTLGTQLTAFLKSFRLWWNFIWVRWPLSRLTTLKCNLKWLPDMTRER
jgi:hypothetical protein